jgi:hypothetical protein
MVVNQGPGAGLARSDSAFRIGGSGIVGESVLSAPSIDHLQSREPRTAIGQNGHLGERSSIVRRKLGWAHLFADEDFRLVAAAGIVAEGDGAEDQDEQHGER